MMVSTDKIGMAVSSFIETELIPKTDTHSRFKMGVIAMFAPKWISNKVEEYQDLLEMNGILMSNGMVDMDCLTRLVYSLFDKYKEYHESVMKMNITLTKDDAEKIVSLVREYS